MVGGLLVFSSVGKWPFANKFQMEWNMSKDEQRCNGQESLVWVV